jgi:branched-chain amino acid transport system permease protein
MNLALEILPRIALFLVVVIAAMPAVIQARMLLLGTSAFFTAGAFSSLALGTTPQSLGTVSLLMGALGGGIVGATLAGVCTRLRGDYFALATLCFGELLRLLLLVSPPFVGPQGVPGIARGTLLGISLNSRFAIAATAMLLLALVSVVTILAMKAPWGAALQATRDNERSARTSGLLINSIRRHALIYAGVWGGLAGAVSVRHLSLADPNAFSLTNSILVLAVLLLTGRPSVPTCLLVGCAISAVAELLRFVATGAMREIAFGLFLFCGALILRDNLRDVDASADRQ